jgi:hypothetical protein
MQPFNKYYDIYVEFMNYESTKYYKVIKRSIVLKKSIYVPLKHRNKYFTYEKITLKECYCNCEDMGYVYSYWLKTSPKKYYLYRILHDKEEIKRLRKLYK